MMKPKALVYAAAALSDSAQTEDYIARGRPLRGLSDAQLAERWQHVVDALAADPSSEPRWRDESDLRHEAELRGRPLTVELTEPALAKPAAQCQVLAREIVGSPARRKALDQRLRDQIATTAEQLASATKN